MNKELEEKIIREVPADDSTSHGEKMLLYWLIRNLKPKNVVETGTHKGLTTCYIAAALKDNGIGHITTCDPTEQWHQRGNFAKFPELMDIITFKAVRGDQLEVEQPVDFFFCDGYHGIQDVLEEIDHFFPKLSKSCVVVFHDCWYGNTDGVNEAIEARGLKTIWLPTKNAIRIYSKHPEKPTCPDEL